MDREMDSQKGRQLDGLTVKWTDTEMGSKRTNKQLAETTDRLKGTKGQTNKRTKRHRRQAWRHAVTCNISCLPQRGRRRRWAKTLWKRLPTPDQSRAPNPLPPHLSRLPPKGLLGLKGWMGWVEGWMGR